ncbi:hypothetical protein, partial [Nocardia vaccinii]|uniref:hypothetical protein n=1 Tax=Nocardia vaccinii TaxID=1822 RepID=UPI000AE09A61
MGLADEQDTCDIYPMSLSPYAARAHWSEHSWHECSVGVAARAVIEGARNRRWDDIDSLVTPQDWVTAYLARNLKALLGPGGQVELVADDTMTAVSMPHALVAWVHDRMNFQAPILAPPVQRLSTEDWAVLTKSEHVPVAALRELRRLGVQILEPGQRLRLPMTSHPDVWQESWWHEWPQRHVRYPDLLGVPPMLVLLNYCFWAAKSPHQLTRRHKEILFEAEA